MKIFNVYYLKKAAEWQDKAMELSNGIAKFDLQTNRLNAPAMTTVLSSKTRNSMLETRSDLRKKMVDRFNSYVSIANDYRKKAGLMPLTYPNI